MKFFVVIALIAAVASARFLSVDLNNLTPLQLAEFEKILAAIQSPSTDPTTAGMLEQMLLNLLGVSPVPPPVNIPAIVDGLHPIHVGPEIIDFPVPEGALNPTPQEPAAPAPSAPNTTPLVQIIVNVKDQSDLASGSPVQVDHVGAPSPVVVVDKPKPPIVKPTPVIVVDGPFEAHPEPVLIGNLPEAVAVAPVIVAPAIVGPEILN